ncbi:CoA ester lyase [Amycolatopsis acidicola]|uniref:CoA ester lyase n=1 Tax=Amycolatopsis acidicola TaxID=2596893 RepID=A0A5N0V8Q5_9PSEU|nr:CoA ester lyase [Amycolatopsis acidicola]KAA9161613.1 CoA ester lyase [Amycolatopsis acidicola]
MIGKARSWLYVPAHRPELLAKAMAGPADAVVYDLEDAVGAQDKDTARANAVDAVGKSWPKPLWVRINPPETPWGERDVAELAGRGPAGVRVPKCDSPDAVARVADRLGAPLHLLVESALGLENAFRLATCHSLVASVSLGEADLLADLRVRDQTALDWARQRVVTANRAAGLPSPPHAVWTDVTDTAGLTADSEAARDRGFFGRSVVHPRQIAPVNEVFTPDHTEVDDARRLLDSLRDKESAAWLDERGRFVDPAVVARSRWVLDLAAQFATEGTKACPTP